MKRLNRYILEKLRINKDTKQVSKTYLDDMLLILDIEKDCKDKVKEIINNWIGDYKKTVYCFCSIKEYNDRLKEIKYDIESKISFSQVDDTLMKKAIELTNGTVYKGEVDNDNVVEKILMSQYDLAIFLFNKKEPIIFEKSHI